MSVCPTKSVDVPLLESESIVLRSSLFGSFLVSVTYLVSFSIYLVLIFSRDVVCVLISDSAFVIKFSVDLSFCIKIN